MVGSVLKSILLFAGDRQECLSHPQRLSIEVGQTFLSDTEQVCPKMES
jgi:hypothetical protein